MLEIRNLVIYFPYVRIILHIFVKVNVFLKGANSMYRCQDCDYEFLYSEEIKEPPNLPVPPYESIAVCPNCKGENFSKIENRYCKYCGRKLKPDQNEYCAKECKRKGEIMWREQARRKNLYEKSSLTSVTRQLEAYNKSHNTNYTYGAFVSKILNKKVQEAQQ